MSAVVGLLIAAALGIWAYSDAKVFERRGVRVGSMAPAAWGWLVALFAIIFGIVYLVQRPKAVAELQTQAYGSNLGSSGGATTNQAAAMSNVATTRPCPYCAEAIQPAAVVCRFCGRDVEPTALAPPPVGTPEQWLRDPSGRHPDRWWDGRQWTQWVRDKPGGTRSEDPPLPSPAA